MWSVAKIVLVVIAACHVLTAEESPDDDAAANQCYKALHCADAGSSQVQWMKDGVPLSTPQSTFSLLLDANRTLASQRVQMSDAGRYTCTSLGRVLTDVQLRVLEEPQEPLLVTARPSDKRPTLGSTTNLYCEMLIAGRSPDELAAGLRTSRVTWSKKGDAANINSSDRVSVAAVERGDFVGARLVIADVKQDDFGEYECELTALHGQVLLRAQLLRPLGWWGSVFSTKSMLLLMAVCSFCLVTGVATKVALSADKKLRAQQGFERIREETA